MNVGCCSTWVGGQDHEYAKVVLSNKEQETGGCKLRVEIFEVGEVFNE